MYWSKKKMIAHAEKYSMGFRAHKGYTFWEKDFDGMAYKTMLRQLISKWGIMSIEMQNAYVNDMAYIHEDGTPEYVDNEPITEPIIEAHVSEVVDPEPTPAPKGRKSAKAEMPTESAPEPTDEELAAFFAGAPIEG
jgi:recombination protein RecT